MRRKPASSRLRWFLSAASSLIFFLTGPTGSGHAQAPELAEGVYVVIGVFGVHNNAVRYMERVQGMGLRPGYGLRAFNRLYYVYDFSSDSDVVRARARRDQLRKDPAFYDAWVLYHGVDPGVEGEVTEAVGTLPVEIPVDNGLDELGDRLGDERAKASPAHAEAPAAVAPAVGASNRTYPVLFSTTNARTLREVPGFIMLVDADREKAMRQVGTNVTHLIEPPSTLSQRMLSICDIFGYQKQQVEFVPSDPLSSPDREVIALSGDTIVVNFQLHRYPLGSTISMFNVYFYNDATLMRPESRFELNSLLDMLKEDETLIITIHGHTNTNSAGKIIRLREDDNNFFEVTPNNVQDYGSAKNLSMERANVIRRWLIQQGIDAERMKLKAWGGKKMIYDKNDPLAKRNVRVDIELMKP
jgi:outer membrane protein OmpA-like peptidoglycan-associated protein